MVVGVDLLAVVVVAVEVLVVVSILMVMVGGVDDGWPTKGKGKSG